MKIFKLYIIFLGLFFVEHVYAQVNILVEISPKAGTTEEQFQVSVKILARAFEQHETPVFSSSEFFTLKGIGFNSALLLIDGKAATEISYSFLLVPTKKLSPGRYTIPIGQVKINNKIYKLPETSFSIRKDSQASGSKPPELDFSQSVNNNTPYVGEQVLYTLKISTVRELFGANISDADFKNFWVEHFDDDSNIKERKINGISVYTLNKALFPLESGKTTIPKLIFTAKVKSLSRKSDPRKDSLFGVFFPNLLSVNPFNYQRKRYYSDEVKLNIKKLPPPPRANLKYIPVGSVFLNSKLSKSSITLGESATLSIELKGDANLRPYELSDPIGDRVNDFTFYKDKPEIKLRRGADKLYFTKTFKIVFVPKKDGELRLPEFEIITFNPKEDKYQIHKTGTSLLQVTPNPNASKLDISAGINILSQERDDKRDIQVLGEDLFPIYQGEKILSKKKEISYQTVLFVLILAPFLFFAAAFFLLRRQQLLLNPLALEKRNAYQNALKSLTKTKLSNNILDDLTTVLISYLEKRLSLKEKNPSAETLASVVSVQTKNKELSSSLQSFLVELQDLRFGGTKNISSNDKDDLLNKAEKIITSIENNIKPTRSSMSLFSVFSSVFLWQLLLLISVTNQGFSESENDLVTKANESYKEGHFTEAILSYKKAIKGGIENGYIYYNLANAFYREALYGRAIASYRKAIQLLPRNPDIKANLILARKKAIDKLATAEENPTSSLFYKVFEPIIFLRARFSNYEVNLAFIIVYLLFWFSVLAYLLNRTSLLRTTSILLLFLAWLSTLYTFGTSFDRLGRPILALSSSNHDRNSCVIIEQRVDIHSGDSLQYQVIFLLHQGAEVEVLRERGQWVEIILPNKKRGWLKQQDVEII